jgi:SAM-dependent methyltransferase
VHDNPRIYDLETDWFTDDLEFWRGLIRDLRPSTLLELGSGTARIAMPAAAEARIHRPDARLLGIDISPAMVQAAREQLTALGPPIEDAIEYRVSDMREVAGDERFDLIFCGLNSLQYLYTLDDRLACFDAVRRQLAPGGRFAFDMFTPVLRYLEEASRAPVERIDLDLRPDYGDVRRFVRKSFERYDQATQIDDTRYEYEMLMANGETCRFTDSLRWYFYFPTELELMLRQSGMRVVDRWGGYGREPFDRRSLRYCWTAELAV